MEKWIKKIDEVTLGFLETFGDLNIEQLNWKPDAEKWSIAQNIDHLIMRIKSIALKGTDATVRPLIVYEQNTINSSVLSHL